MESQDNFVSGALTSDVSNSNFVQVAENNSLRRNLLKDTQAFSSLHCAINCWTKKQCKAILYNSHDVGSANCQLYMESYFQVAPASITHNVVYLKKGK